MGMYTALSLGVELRKDVPKEVLDILSFMVYGHDLNRSDDTPPKPAHPFFSCDRWCFILRCDSYYFSWQTGWTFEEDNISDSYYLSGVSNVKNYANEIDQFLDWIHPYLHEAAYGYLGWTQYEESDYPTLIMRKYDQELEEGRLILVNPERLIATLMRGDKLIEALMPGVGKCVIDVGELNQFFMDTSELKKDLLL